MIFSLKINVRSILSALAILCMAFPAESANQRKIESKLAKQFKQAQKRDPNFEHAVSGVKLLGESDNPTVQHHSKQMMPELMVAEIGQKWKECEAEEAAKAAGEEKKNNLDGIVLDLEQEKAALKEEFARYVSSNDIKAIENFFKTKGSRIRATDVVFDYFSPVSGSLTCAIREARSEMVDTLLRPFPELREGRINRELPCIYALKRAVSGDVPKEHVSGLYSITKALYPPVTSILIKGHPVISNTDWDSIMSLAARGEAQFIHYLLGLDISRERVLTYENRASGNTLAHLAVEYGNRDVLAEVQASNPSILNKKNKKGLTPKDLLEKKLHSFEKKKIPQGFVEIRSFFDDIAKAPKLARAKADNAMDDLLEQERLAKQQRNRERKQKGKKKHEQQEKRRELKQRRKQEQQEQEDQRRKQEQQEQQEQEEQELFEKNKKYFYSVISSAAEREKEGEWQQRSLARAKHLKDCELLRYTQDYAQSNHDARQDEWRARQRAIEIATELAQIGLQDRMRDYNGKMADVLSQKGRAEQMSDVEGAQRTCDRTTKIAMELFGRVLVKQPLAKPSLHQPPTRREKVDLPSLRKHALIEAAVRSEFAVLGQLAEAGVDPQASKRGVTVYDVLEQAVKNGNIRQDEYEGYLRAIEDGERFFVDYKNGLQQAAQEGNTKFVDHLYKKFKTNALVNQTKVPLRNRHANLINVLDNYGRPPLEVAIDAKQFKFANLLIDKFPTAIAGKNIRLMSTLLSHHKKLDIEHDAFGMEWPVEVFKDKYLGIEGAQGLCARLLPQVGSVYIPKGEYSVAALYRHCYGQQLVPSSKEDVEGSDSSDVSESE